MSTNLAVRTAWKENVFNEFEQIEAYNHLFHYVSEEHSPDKGLSNGALNHWQYQVGSIERPFMFQRNELEFVVTVVRIIEDDPEGENINTLLDDFRDLFSLVQDMGVSWDSTVDLPTEFPREVRPELIDWGSTKAWRGTVVFKAVKEITS